MICPGVAHDCDNPGCRHGGCQGRPPQRPQQTIDLPESDRFARSREAAPADKVRRFGPDAAEGQPVQCRRSVLAMVFSPARCGLTGCRYPRRRSMP